MVVLLASVCDGLELQRRKFGLLNRIVGQVKVVPDVWWLDTGHAGSLNNGIRMWFANLKKKMLKYNFEYTCNKFVFALDKIVRSTEITNVYEHRQHKTEEDLSFVIP